MSDEMIVMDTGARNRVRVEALEKREATFQRLLNERAKWRDFEFRAQVQRAFNLLTRCNYYADLEVDFIGHEPRCAIRAQSRIDNFSVWVWARTRDEPTPYGFWYQDASRVQAHYETNCPDTLVRALSQVLPVPPPT